MLFVYWSRVEFESMKMEVMSKDSDRLFTFCAKSIRHLYFSKCPSTLSKVEFSLIWKTTKTTPFFTYCAAITRLNIYYQSCGSSSNPEQISMLKMTKNRLLCKFYVSTINLINYSKWLNIWSNKEHNPRRTIQLQRCHLSANTIRRINCYPSWN